MYLPDAIDGARVLVTVKTYPQPSGKYGELVCTAGLLDGEKWIRVYPVSAELISSDERLPKYSWIRLNLKRKGADFRPESYSPTDGIDGPIMLDGHIGTSGLWSERRRYVEAEVFESMTDLIALSRKQPPKSLATLQPREIVDFVCEPAARDWRSQWLAQSSQGNMFSVKAEGRTKPRHLVRKLPFNYYYEFLTRGDTRPRRLKIEDWEIGALFLSCLHRADGDETLANRLVRDKYYSEFCSKKDLLLFLGTTLKNHWVSRNPFLIIGVFYPPSGRQSVLL